MDSGKCHEKCTCHPDKDDKDTSSVDANKITAHPLHGRKGRKKLAHPHLGSKEMNKIKHLFTKWIKEYSPEGHKATPKGQTLKDERVNFIDKMLNNYQHFRRKEKALMLLQAQQNELKDQQEHLENLLTKEEKAISKTGSTHDSVATPSPVTTGRHHSHKDDVNITISTANATQAPPTTQAPLNQQTSTDIELIKKQIAEIQKQQSFLGKQQAELAVQVAKEQALFEQARQLIMLLLKQEQGGEAASPSAAPTQSDYGGELTAEALPNGEPVQSSALLNQLQNVLSKLVFTEDGNALQGSPDEGQQMMYVQRNQEDQSSEMQNENSVYEKNDQAPANTIYNVPIEVDRNDLNNLGQRNSLFGRNDVDSTSEDDNENMPFAMADPDYSDDETEPEYTVMEKKTLHATNLQVKSNKKGRVSKKDNRSGDTKKHKNHVGSTPS